MKKLFFIDYDTVNKDLDELIKKTTEDNYVILMSNYNAKFCEILSKNLNTAPYIICNNGSYTKNYLTNEILIDSPLDKDMLKELVKYFVSHDINYYLNGKDHVFSNIKNNLFVNASEDTIDKTIDNYPIYQIMIDSNNKNRMLTIPNILEEKYPSLKINEKNLTNKPYYYIINGTGTSRVNAIYEIIDKLKYQKENITIIGKTSKDFKLVDEINDNIK